MKQTIPLLTALLLAPLTGLAAADTSKLNICVLLADDLRSDCLSMFGHQVAKTPNIDKLCANGFAFRNAYTLGSNSGAVCMPSRAMISSGRNYLRPDVEAMLKGGPKYQHKEGAIPLLGQTLHQAGYASMRSGKFGSNPNQVDQFYDQRLDGGKAEGNVNNLIGFIKEQAGKKPMFLYLAPHEPHDPQFAPDEYYDRYKPEDMTMPVNFLPQHPFDNGEMTIRDEMTLPWPRTKENVGGKLARYYASIAYLDDQIGRLIAALKEAGEFERTVFVMGADNGLSLGEHGLLGKQNLYEHGGMHVPMIFVGPGIPKDETKSFAYLYDIYPTMCELAGIPIPGGLDAKSLVPVITGKQPKVRDYMFNAYQASQRSIRDERWKLIRYPLVNKTQLFDLQADPHEMTDLADKPESAPKIAELTAQLETARQEFGDTDPLIVPNPKSPDWSPPAPVKDAAKPKPATATTQPGGRIRADSKLHFERWDTNKDDSLTLEEYQSGQKNRKGLEAGFKTYDKNADGKLSREEYVDPRSK